MLNDRLFMVTDNAHLIALDRITGRLLWDVAIADSKQNYGDFRAAGCQGSGDIGNVRRR